MADQNHSPLRRLAKSLLAATLVSYPLVARPLLGETLPWETWQDLHRLPVLHQGDQSLLRSSHCPDGCRFDRHSEGDWRYIYVDGEEGTIFEESGPGAITRIWMTTGVGGVSTPLNPEVRIRIYLDGSTAPIVDVPLPALFDGSTPPFAPPLVGGRLTSSGGNFSYVPIPYRTGCRVSLVGADETRLWYQINFHRLADADGVTSFTGDEDLSAQAALMSTQGADPWPPGSVGVRSGSVPLEPGTEHEIEAVDGHGSVTALELGLDPSQWPEVELRLSFDDQLTVQMRLDEFFAMGRVGPEPTRSLLVGLNAEGVLYSYFPMPFFRNARIALLHRGSPETGSTDPGSPDPGSPETGSTGTGSTETTVTYRVRVDNNLPLAGSGLFGAALSQNDATTTGIDFQTLSLDGHGKLVGTFLELGATAPGLRDYLEGDERLFIDHSPHPVVYGTGVEDAFNGGFYFDMGPFSSALHGAPYTTLDVDGLPYTAAYRLMLTDGATFESRIEAGLESGPTGNVSMAARSVTWFYRRQPAQLSLWDRLVLAHEGDRAKHHYQVDGAHTFKPLDGLFEGEPPTPATGTGVYRPPGSASLTLAAYPTSTRFRLRRRLDAAAAGQRAAILVNGEVAGHFPAVDVNQDRRWREIDIDLSVVDPPTTELAISVIAEAGPPSGNSDTFTAFRYELWADGASMIFADGFESGDFRAWTVISQRP